MEKKNNRMISVCFQSKLFNIMAIQVYALITNAVEAEVEWFPSKSGKLCVFIGNRHRKLFLMCQVNILFLPLVAGYTVVLCENPSCCTLMKHALFCINTIFLKVYIKIGQH